MTPNAPSKLDASETSIPIGWVEPNPRGTPITGYEVWWNGGGSGSTFTKLADTNPATRTLTKSSLTPGEYYSFKILAKNGVGPSQFSAPTVIRAATVPTTPLTPVLVYQDTSNIQFNWLEPYDGKDPVYDYKVLWDAGRGDAIFDVLETSTFGQV